MIVGRMIGGHPVTPKSYVIETEDGREFYGILVDEETVFTATENDIRKGKVAATGNGVVVGTKVIPTYHTVQGYRIITAGNSLNIPNPDEINDYYDYTKLQALVCSFNTNLANSVSTEYVSIDDFVYPVSSVESVSEVTKNHSDKTIELGITNETSKPMIIRYFSYKEIE